MLFRLPNQINKHINPGFSYLWAEISKTFPLMCNNVPGDGWNQREGRENDSLMTFCEWWNLQKTSYSPFSVGFFIFFFGNQRTLNKKRVQNSNLAFFPDDLLPKMLDHSRKLLIAVAIQRRSGNWKHWYKRNNIDWKLRKMVAHLIGSKRRRLYTYTRELSFQLL